jgi:hypothetical protein
MKPVKNDAVMDRDKVPFLWFDFFSVEQDDPKGKLLGIKSLLHYAANSTAMLIPTPHPGMQQYMCKAPPPNRRPHPQSSTVPTHTALSITPLGACGCRPREAANVWQARVVPCRVLCLLPLRRDG